MTYVRPATARKRGKPNQPAARAGRPIVLWVDDDEFAAFRMSEPLADFDVKVLHAEDPAEALRKLRRYSGAVALVVLDVMMPGGSVFGGKESQGGVRTGILLAREIKARYPGLPIVGCSLSDADADWFRKNTDGFIRKGFESPAEVAGRIAGLLGVGIPERLRRVFIVHGRDDKTRLEVEEYVRGRGLAPIVLQKQPGTGEHILQKLELNAAVDFVLVVLSPDDLGGLAAGGQPQLRPRARQNVVFELGYFYAKVGPRRVRALRVGEIEIPSDYHGVEYIDIDAMGEWTKRLDADLRAAGVLDGITRGRSG